MPDQIPQHFTTEFSTNWEHRAQQTKPRLAEYVTFDDFNGERKRYDRLQKQNSRRRTERNAPTNPVDVSSDSRWAARVSFELPNILDADDAANLGVLVLPTSEYVQSHAFAYNRDCDDISWQAALDDVVYGETGTSTLALPAGQKIAAGGTGLTKAKLFQVREILEGADLDDDAERVFVYSPQQMTNLLNTTEATSADYVNVKALAEGHVDKFMGFTFKKNTRLRKASTTRTCVAWVKGAIKVMRGAKMSKIDLRPDLSYATQIYSKWHLGAVRLYDEGVVQVDCTEA